MSWVGRYTGRLLLYPHADLQLLSPLDISQHFYGDAWKDPIPPDLGSSLLIFLQEGNDNAPRTAFEFCRHLCNVSLSKAVSPTEYGGRHLVNPLTASTRTEHFRLGIWLEFCTLCSIFLFVGLLQSSTV